MCSQPKGAVRRAWFKELLVCERCQHFLSSLPLLQTHIIMKAGMAKTASSIIIRDYSLDVLVRFGLKNKNKNEATLAGGNLL